VIAPHVSVIGGKADMAFCGANVCFWPICDIDQLESRRLFLGVGPRSGRF